MTTFEDFASTRLPALVRFAAVLTHDRGIAEDVCQEVVIRVHRDWARIALLDHPEAYVRRMIVNEYLSWRRKWARVIPFPTVGSERSVADHADRVADRDALLTRLGRLPAQQRTVLVLRFYEDLPDAEIAAVLGCSESTVRGYAMRALRALRIDMEPVTPPATVTSVAKTSAAKTSAAKTSAAKTSAAVTAASRTSAAAVTSPARTSGAVTSPARTSGAVTAAATMSAATPNGASAALDRTTLDRAGLPRLSTEPVRAVTFEANP